MTWEPNRRDLFSALSGVAGILVLSRDGKAQDLGSVINLANPASHCNQKHDHNALPWPLPQAPWQGLLDWAMKDTGYNEGAAAAVQIALQYGLGLPGPIAQLPAAAVGNVWKRREMMRFACDVAKHPVTVIPATGIAIASQWHNCHAFKALVFHAPEVSTWVVKG